MALSPHSSSWQQFKLVSQRVGGGAAVSSHLGERRKVGDMCKEHGVSSWVPAYPQLCDPGQVLSFSPLRFTSCFIYNSPSLIHLVCGWIETTL